MIPPLAVAKIKRERANLSVVTGSDDTRFTKKFEDAAFIDAIEALNDATTREIAERVGCQKETARQRLKELAERGAVIEQRVGYQAVWDVDE